MKGRFVVKFIGAVVILILNFSGEAWAKQLQFKVTTDDFVEFNYQWLDQAQQTQSLSFTIDKVMIFDKFRNFKSYSADHAKKYVDQKIRQSLIKSPLPEVKVNFLGYADNLQIELQASVIDFTKLKDLILNNFPDQNVREVANYVLGFVQSIPYSTLESRVTSTGAGFNPPLQTLWQNQGDCDSKVTLTTAIFRALMPRMKMMLVFIDNHALLAMNIKPEENELTITVDGEDYILAEPTGPALMKLGEISNDSEFAIRNGRYYAEPFI